VRGHRRRCLAALSGNRQPADRRIVSWEIFPLSFREFLDGKGIESDGPQSTKQRLTIQKAFEDYWQVGGFPCVN
jgi:predicted AAA+ superfamily ATPase